jgi:HD-GYP domain-containing protein (c-di-GMP phosphodiesterase class II)
MSFFPAIFRSDRGKADLHLLFLAALAGQALALAVGLWLEQKLLDSATRWSPSGATIVRGSVSPDLDHGDASADVLLADFSPVVVVKVIAFVWIFCSQALIAFLVVCRWNTIRERQRATDANAFAKQNHDLVRTRDAVIFGLAKLAESRDPETGQHLERIAHYATRLAEAMRRHPRFETRITPTFLKLLGISSALHDIGKVGVEDSVLLKPGRLTEAERAKIQQHTLLGGDCIEQIESRLGASNFLEMAREIALYHHERWDGCGYPNGLAREEIPLAARIIAVADVYDALSVRRVYKEPFRHEKCVRIIRDGAGSQFDPHIVEVFLEIEAEFQKCAQAMSDSFAASEHANADGASVMTSEQEEILTRITSSEEFCHPSNELVSAAATSNPDFPETYGGA